MMDRYAIAAMKERTIIGRLLQKNSKVGMFSVLRKKKFHTMYTHRE